MKGSQNQLDNLHGLLTTYMTGLLQSGKELTPGELGQINAFLKNNNISHNQIQESSVTNLLEAFKDYDDENEIDTFFVPEKIPYKGEDNEE